MVKFAGHDEHDEEHGGVFEGLHSCVAILDLKKKLKRRQSVTTKKEAAKGLKLEQFRKWTSRCQVRKVHAEFEGFCQVAQDDQRSLDDVMKEQGYMCNDDFIEECPQFPLTCDLDDLGELGSGFVMYFYLLRFFVIVLLAQVLFSVPAMVVYAKESSLSMWWWHDWHTGGWLDDEIVEKPCACRGDNGGFTGVGSWANASYGTRCGAWDLEWCKAHISSHEVGKWCCRTWCFADLACRVPAHDGETGSPSMANKIYGHLVRATTDCVQDDALLAAECAAMQDSGFNQSGLESAHQDFTSKIWLTPGNLGPMQGEDATPLVFHVICVTFLCFSAIGMTHFLQRVEENVDLEVRMPSDFAILVTGLPRSAKSEKKIAEFFTNQAVRGGETQVTSVVIGWDMSGWNARNKELAKLRKSVEKGKLEPMEVENAKMRIAELSANQWDVSELDSTGVAVVCFRWRRDLLRCVDRWHGHFWAQYFRRETGKYGLPGSELPLFENDGSYHKIQVRRAPNPGDINWSDLDKNYCWTWLSVIRGHSIMFLIIVVSFCITWGGNELHLELLEEARVKQSYSFQALSFLPAAVISLVNFALQMAAWCIAWTEHHATKTDQEFAEAYMMSYAMLINTSGVIFWVNMQPRQWYLRGGLVDAIIYCMVIDAVVTRLFFLIDYWYWMNLYKRWRWGEDEVAALDKKIKENIHQRTMDEVEALIMVKKHLQEAKMAFEPMELYNPDRYARALTTFLVCVFYAPLLPLAPLIGVFALCLQYAIDKYLLLRWCKRQKPQNSMLALSTLKAVKYLAPLALTVSFFIFLVPAWKDPLVVRNVALVSVILYMGITVVVPERVWCAVFHYLKPTKKNLERKPIHSMREQLREQESALNSGHTNIADPIDEFYRAQYLWPRDLKYHKDHELYKELGKENPEILQEDEEVRDFQDMVKKMMKTIQRRSEAPKEGLGGASVSGRRSRGGVPHPSTYGVHTEGVTVTFLSVMPPDGDEGPGRVPADGPTGPNVGAGEPQCKSTYWPASARPALDKHGTFISFEFETQSGWKPFDDDCQQFLADRYQKFIKNTGSERIMVRTGGKEISVDFGRMTQRGAGGRVRKIRRMSKE
mmetsp:Transcript_17435/g.60879  ORF Transcript_17435/g.60879 Transcript_17435/m.60879 type:complete len:1104 (+) Transcript_17435:112-3423(+)|eukprot:CAMPEP_0203939200 /NCGR_PEP_ID=MMETSP0359-20131031/76041_1 /ASSEMBLY_ACC=CAM_ASM_000338 /TAXON_ID=268821 /ORGANISM="Scrippsiella Hangoei, Strain SHTV-5" /LENGTH=1103 /DNA_ID=CAMNT_0050869499 /DNA_START=77 /DNA_END=3388 /DNA_ORIENTATION=+